MSRMLELVRTSQLSFHQMMSASKGALRVPAAEMVEILVYIAEHNKIYGDTARMTLGSWAEASAKQIASDPNTPREVLDYWASPKNLRPALFSALIENPSVSVAKLSELARTLKGELLETFIASRRVQSSFHILQALSANPSLTIAQTAQVKVLLGIDPGSETQSEQPELTAADAGKSSEAGSVPADPEAPPVTATSAPASPGQLTAENAAQVNATEDTPTESEGDGPDNDDAVVTYLAHHANEIVSEGDKPFHAIGGVFDEFAPAEEPAPAIAVAAAAGAGATGGTTITGATDATAVASSAATAPAPSPSPVPAPKWAGPKKPLVKPEEDRRESTLQRIAKLDIKGRIQMAMKGTKEERSILVRDGTKLVALAVLESPKISDGEVEKIASQKNVLEAVLRAVPMKRRFAKNYIVMRNLVANPRTPLDVALGLMKNLLVADLKNLSGNKEISETVRKLALRMFKQKSDAANK